MNDAEIDAINNHILNGQTGPAKLKLLSIYETLKSLDDNSTLYAKIYNNVAALLVNVATRSGDQDAAEKACMIFESIGPRILKFLPAHEYYYNLGNAKSCLVKDRSVFDLSFKSIEVLVEVKNCYWRSVKEARNKMHVFPELYVNLANSLKRQFRFSEALRYYQFILSDHPDLPEAYVNLSTTLLMLNTVSNTYSVKGMSLVLQGYEKAMTSGAMPPGHVAGYMRVAQKIRTSIEETGSVYSCIDEAETAAEFRRLSKYRQYCLREKLTLSEHGLYCSCNASSRDDLTIPLSSLPVSGGFILKMESVLNRLKSEFSFARRCFYEYHNNVNYKESVVGEE